MIVSEFRSAKVKWPKVPACHGWLSLDRRGFWRLKGQTVTHPGLIAFINGHYAADDQGNWIFWNGPQSVFVDLDYTPYVFRLEANGRLVTHTGDFADAVDTVFLDDEGNALLHSEHGIGLLDDRDLSSFMAECCHADGEPAGDDALIRTMAGGSGAFWRDLPLQAIKRANIERRFGFCAAPAP